MEGYGRGGRDLSSVAFLDQQLRSMVTRDPFGGTLREQMRVTRERVYHCRTSSELLVSLCAGKHFASSSVEPLLPRSPTSLSNLLTLGVTRVTLQSLTIPRPRYISPEIGQTWDFHDESRILPWPTS